jgi:hypothetical protein
MYRMVKDFIKIILLSFLPFIKIFYSATNPDDGRLVRKLDILTLLTGFS